MSSSDDHRLAEEILPGELWGECWQFVDTKDIWNVRLVCKEWARTGQPFLYRVLHCWSPNQEDVDDKNWDMWCKHFLWSATRFVVVATGSFVYYVEEWSFSGIEQTRSFNDTNANIRGIGVLVEAYQSALTIFLNTLQLYPNLHTITLTSIKVDKNVFDALNQVIKLRNLSLVETNTIIRPAPPSISPWPLQKLRIVTSEKQSSEDTGDNGLLIVSPAMLDTLILHSYEFSEACLRPLAEAQESFRVLTYLSLNLRRSTLELLRDILQLCPVLETLEINDIDYTDSREIQYPSLPLHFSAPLLENYHGPAYLAARVLYKSPFKSLSLHNGKSRENSYTQSEMYKLLRPLAINIPTHLGLSVVNPDARLFDTLATVFSAIKSLYICYNDPAPRHGTEDDSTEYRQVVLIGACPFVWPIRPRNTLMVRLINDDFQNVYLHYPKLQGLLDRLVICESSLPQGLVRLRFTQADPYSSRVITPQEQRQYIERLSSWYRDLMFFQLGDNPPLIRSERGKPWYEAR